MKSRFRAKFTHGNGEAIPFRGRCDSLKDVRSEIMAANKNLLILGAGQYGQVAKEVAETMGIFDDVAFLDDVQIRRIWKR